MVLLQRFLNANWRTFFRIETIEDFFFFGFIVLLPYDNFPFPIPGVSKPISIIFLVCGLLISMVHGRFKVNFSLASIVLIIFGMYGLFITCIQSINNPFTIKQTNSVAVAIKGIVPLIMYVLGFIWIENYALKSKIKYQKILFWLLISLIVPVIYGLIQVFASALHLTPILKILAGISYLFTTRSHEEFEIAGRLRLLTMEPSWAGLQMVVYFAPVLLLSIKYYSVSKKRVLFGLIGFVVLLMSTGSAIGVLWSLCIACIFGFYKIFQFFKSLKFKIVTLIVLILAPVLLGGVYAVAGQNMTYQFKKVSVLQGGGLEKEASTATRIICPYVGYLVFTNENPVFGVGLSMFGFYMPKYAPDWYSIMDGEGKALADPNSAYFASTRNFFTKLLAEMGLVGFGIWLLFIYFVYRNLGWKTWEERVWWLFLLTLVMGYMNYDSMANFYIQTLLGLVAVHHRWKEVEKNA